MAWSDILQYLASFALVVGLLVALLFALRKLQGMQGFARKQQRLQMIESMAMGPRHKIALIRCDGQELLVGITATQITPLSGPLAAAQAAQAAPAPASARAPAPEPGSLS